MEINEANQIKWLLEDMIRHMLEAYEEMTHLTITQITVRRAELLDRSGRILNIDLQIDAQ